MQEALAIPHAKLNRLNKTQGKNYEVWKAPGILFYFVNNTSAINEKKKTNQIFYVNFSSLKIFFIT